MRVFWVRDTRIQSFDSHAIIKILLWIRDFFFRFPFIRYFLYPCQSMKTFHRRNFNPHITFWDKTNYHYFLTPSENSEVHIMYFTPNCTVSKSWKKSQTSVSDLCNFHYLNFMHVVDWTIFPNISVHGELQNVHVFGNRIFAVVNL